MLKSDFYTDTYTALSVSSKTGRDTYCVCIPTKGPKGERVLARFKTRAEARAFERGYGMANMHHAG